MLPMVDRLMFFFSSRRRHTRFDCDWSSDVCSSDLGFTSHFEVVVGLHPRRMRIAALDPAIGLRSEERRVGKECRSWWSPYHLKKKVIYMGEMVLAVYWRKSNDSQAYF